ARSPASTGSRRRRESSFTSYCGCTSRDRSTWSIGTRTRPCAGCEPLPPREETVMNITRRHLLGAAAASLALAGLPARAQAWPSRPVRLVCPYAPGGPSDILTRLLGGYLSDRLGQPFVVENRAGAGTRIANDYVAKAAPDGYTLLHAAAPIAIGQALYSNLPYDLRKSFEPIVSTAI